MVHILVKYVGVAYCTVQAYFVIGDGDAERTAVAGEYVAAVGVLLLHFVGNILICGLCRIYKLHIDYPGYHAECDNQKYSVYDSYFRKYTLHSYFSISTITAGEVGFSTLEPNSFSLSVI